MNEHSMKHNYSSTSLPATPAAADNGFFKLWCDSTPFSSPSSPHDSFAQSGPLSSTLE